MKSREETRLTGMIENGYMMLGPIISPAITHKIVEQVRASRDLSASLFMTAQDYEANPVHIGVNPAPGRNYTEACAETINAIEADEELAGALAHLLGPDYQIMDRKFVVGVPQASIPPWVTKKIKGNRVNNLGAFIKPQYRDITYFWGIDLHQDIIDWKDREADFITLYIYLSDVGDKDAPLYILPKSHRYGATMFPHDLELIDADKGLMRYRADDGRDMVEPYRKLLGEAGTVNLWHACMLHGTQPTGDDRFRVSLRYLIARDPKVAHCGLDDVNDQIEGALSLSKPRDDLDKSGVARIAGNKINEI